MKVKSLRTQIIVNFCLFALFLSVMFSLFNFLFLYSVEDEFLFGELKEEATFLKEEYEKSDQWPTPRKTHMKIYQSADNFPADLKGQFHSNRKRTEFFGAQGRHYHILPMASSAGSVFLVAEVSQHLIIRPIRHKILLFFGAAGLSMTVLACWLAYRIAGKTISPLTHLADLVKGTQPGQLPQKFADDYPQNEIGILAQTLESSLNRIACFIEREKHFNRDVSHDLRTPIAVVRSGLELIRKSPSLSEKDLKLLARIEAANLQMSHIVQTLLELAREEHSQNPPKALQILPIVEKNIIQNAYILKNKNVEVNVNIQPNDKVTVSSGVLEILLSNLISNAFQFTHEGQVNITFENKVLSVSNTGPHLEDRMLGAMSKGDESQGFGLGLSIVSRLCEHHNLQFGIKKREGDVRVAIEFDGKIPV